MDDFDQVVETATRLGLSDPADQRWPGVLEQLLPTTDSRRGFIEWATHHPRWQFNVAEAAERICAKPTEATVFILSDIVEERLDDE